MFALRFFKSLIFEKTSEKNWYNNSQIYLSMYTTHLQILWKILQTVEKVITKYHKVVYSTGRKQESAFLLQVWGL